MEKRKYSPRREGQYKLASRLNKKRRMSWFEWVLVAIIVVSFAKMVYDNLVGY